MTTNTLGDSLPQEIMRCIDVLMQYAELRHQPGVNPEFGIHFIKEDILSALKAVMEGDTVGMIQAYEKLKDCK